MLQILSRTPGEDDSAGDDAARPTVINEALDILINIHRSFVSPEDQYGTLQSYGEAEDSPSEDAKRRRMLHALLDLISLEGIYPSLSSGVGIPLQQRVISVLPAGVIAKQAQTVASSVPHDEPLLRRIIDVLVDVLFDLKPSLQPIIRGRILSDIISGTSDLAFNPNTVTSSHRRTYQKTLAKIIDEYVFIASAICGNINSLQYPNNRFVAHIICVPPVGYCAMVQVNNLQPDLASSAPTRRSGANHHVHCITVLPIARPGSTGPIKWTSFNCTGYHANLTTPLLRAIGF